MAMKMKTSSFSFISSSSYSSYFPLHRQSFSLSFPSLPPHLKKQRLQFVKVNSLSEQNKKSAESETIRSSSLQSPSPSSSPDIVENDDKIEIQNETSSSSSISSAYRWCAALGGIGFVETAYLTFLKFTDSDAFCPTGGGASCTTILSSAYSSVFGVPLPLFGMLAYGLVTVVGLQLGAKKSKFDTETSDDELLLIGTTTSMAVASAYFLYILTTEFPGESCLYCLTSAALSFSLLFISLKSFKSHKLQKVLGLQLSVASLVVLALTGSYGAVQPISSSMSDTELPYFETEVTKESSPLTLSLAKHLQSIGAKLYGAFWCSHCQDQKEMFGREAAKLLDYVECFPDGVMKGTKMAQACVDLKLEGFPTWVINGQVLSGEKQLSELAELSGIKLEHLNGSK